MERFTCKELLKKRWRDPRDDPCLMHNTSPQKSYHDLKEVDTIPDASFVSSLKCLKSSTKLVAGIATNSILSVLL